MSQGFAEMVSLATLAAETGVETSTLMTWHRRFGFPEPVRDRAGVRRFLASAVADVRAVTAAQEQGTDLETAIDAILRTARVDVAAEPSIFAAVLDSLDGVVPRVLTKRTLLAVTWAIDDDRILRADRPFLVAAFQREPFYDASRARWERFAADARAMVLIATGDQPSETPNTLWVPVAPEPLDREWAVVCDASDVPAVLTARELPGQDDVPASQRCYEAVWSLDPATTRRAARAALEVAVAASTPGAAAVLADLDTRLVTSRPDTWAADRFHHRVVAYVDRHAH